MEVVMLKFSVGLKFLHRVSVSGLYVMGNVFRNLIMGLHSASKTAVKKGFNFKNPGKIEREPNWGPNPTFYPKLWIMRFL